MAQQITYGVQRDPLLNEARGKVMAEIVPAEFVDPCAQKNVSPGLFKSGSDVKDTLGIPGLFAPSPQDTDSFLIERHMTGLSILGIPAFNGEQPTIEVHANPPHLEHLTAPESCIHGEQDGRC